MVRARFALLLLAVAWLPILPASGGGGIVREPISFSVTNPLAPGQTFTINGTMIRPRAGCTGSVLLAMHGLSYGAWAWDFPLRPDTYSVAQAFAKRGYAMVAVDRLGYGTSAGQGMPDHPNGYTLTVEGYAEMAAQMARQLRAGTYHSASPAPFAHVGLIGHSAGTEVVELAAGLHPGIADVLIATAYTHEPWVNNFWLEREWVQGDNVRALQSDYEYFETDPATRAADFYTENADADVIALDNARANLTPSGEVFTISPQPSRFVLWRIGVPTLVVLAERDALFPASFTAQEKLYFVGARDLRFLTARGDGHTFFLHRNAPALNKAMADWLGARSGVFPAC
ncbi:MAG: alpha/beta hydrolase [Actinomycetota bacterium]